MTSSDVPTADQLRAAAGWNQTPADWFRLLRWQPNGCFVAEFHNEIVGTVTTTVYAAQLAWIGMLLVHPSARQRGIGQALLDRALAFLKAHTVPCVKLDATPQGQRLYEKLGFRVECELARWEASPLQPLASANPSSAIRPWQKIDLGPAAEIDRAAFGIERPEHLDDLSDQSTRRFTAAAAGKTAGFGFGRPGARAFYFGPICAGSPQLGELLIEALARTAPAGLVFWDIPERNERACSIAQRLGFIRQRPFIRMVLGENLFPTKPAHIYGITDPATG